MIAIAAFAFALLVTLALAALVMLYVAYPQQGRDIPRAEWLSDAMQRFAGTDRHSDTDRR